MFNPNDSFLYIIVSIVIAFVIAQSVFFLFKALRRAKELGITTKTVRNTVLSAALFTLAPAFSILIGVIALSQALGFPLPWLRLSVVGALTYETTAAAAGAIAVGEDITRNTLITDARAFSTIVWVMTIGIIIGLIQVPVFGRKIEDGVTKLKVKDKKWGEIFMTGLFLGMISAFLGFIFKDIRTGLTGWIPVFVLICSALMMVICGALYNATKAKWITDYALPVSMLLGMALSIPITNLVGSIG